MHFCKSHRAALCMTAFLKTEYVIILSEAPALSLVVDDARVVSAVTVSVVHDVSLVLPWSCRAVAHGVAYTLRAACGCECKVVFAVSLVEPWSFLVILDMRKLDDVSRVRDHVLVELYIIEVRVAPVHVCLTVIVDPYGRVDVIPVLLLPYKSASERIHEWSVWRVSHEHADSVAVDRAVHVELSVTLHDLLSPCSVVVLIPFEISEACNGSAVLPVDHICSSIEKPVPHYEVLTVVIVVARVEIEGISDDDR